MNTTRPPKIGARKLVQRFAAAAGADLQTLHQQQQVTREFLADLSARVDRIEAQRTRTLWARLRGLFGR